jgi:toxin ParE1/3/4
MARVYRFRRAEEDLLAISEYIAIDSPAAAANWLEKIERTLNLLALHPMVGEDVSHFKPNLRRFCQGNYLLFFAPRADGIDLVRVLHGSRKIEDLFR